MRFVRLPPMSRPRKLSRDTLQGLPTTKRYLIGVSGGRDSMALLDWLLECGYRKLVVCHLDHRLRGRSSAADARFVERLAIASGLIFEGAVVDVRKLAARTKRSIELAARSARYSFFAEVARRRRCKTIFLGHHAGDLVETFLINLFRGTGTRGLRSIAHSTKREIDGVKLTIVRPLLTSTRADIDGYLTSRGLEFREDASNESLEPLRNRVRHRIIPFLEREFGRDIRSAIQRAATIASDEDALLEEMIPASANSAKLSVAELCKMPVALQRRSLTKWLRTRAVKNVGFEMVERVRALLDPSGIPAKVNVTGGRHTRRRAGELFIE